MADPASVVVNGSVGSFFSRQQVASAGNYFVATNPTPGTAIQYDLITSYSATADGFCVINNNNPIGSNINCYPDYLKFHMTGTAPTGTTVMEMAVFTDVVASCTPSAGSVTYTPNNTNTGSTKVSNCTVYLPTGGAAMTIPAASASRKLVGRTSIPTSLGITGDTYLLQFGGNFGDLGGEGGGTAVRATAAARLACQTTPVELTPGYGVIVLMWWLTQAANKPQFEYEVGMSVV